jgi:MOSC domain-containing protein YiiM
MGVAGWVKRFAEEGRPGAYLRVLKSGPVAAGDSITVVDRPAHGVTIGDVFAGLAPEQAQALLDVDRPVAPKVEREARKALTPGRVRV